MAEKRLLKSYLDCHVCSETFRDPVTLTCSHNFCSSCLMEFWEKAGNKNCPICKKKSSMEDPIENSGLKELADSFAGIKKPRLSETEENVKTQTVCTKHKEEARLFFEDEQRAVCPVCEFSLHHKVVPIEQAVSDLKEKMKHDLKSLQDKKNTCKQVEDTYNHMIQHLEKQLQSTEKKIRAEFKKLHQFLEEEEKSRLETLREEEKQKEKTISTEMKKIQDQISSLSDMISAVEADLQKDNMTFLSSYESTQSRSRTQCSQPDPHLLSGVLIDEAKHLGNLSFRVWEKMKEKVHFSPVILDPNTAYEWLYLSDDLTTATNGNTPQTLPKNSERYAVYPSVFGSESFNSGKHSWDVEVGDHPYWLIGVAKESVERKGHHYSSPEFGFWCLWYKDGQYGIGANKTITVEPSPQKIRVQLDYDGGKVSFYNSENKSHIHTYREDFTEKLLPYFTVCSANNTKTSVIKICPTEVSLKFSDEWISHPDILY